MSLTSLGASSESNRNRDKASYSLVIIMNKRTERATMIAVIGSICCVSFFTKSHIA